MLCWGVPFLVYSHPPIVLTTAKPGSPRESLNIVKLASTLNILSVAMVGDWGAVSPAFP